ncbi:unnamed protein product [Rhodiola kirilowii]
MDEDMAALRRQHTWDLVPRPPNANIVGSKWVFRLKYFSDGSIDRHKARLVAQGFSQIPGFDFDHTFSPVVKAATVRTVLAIATMRKWPLHQLDVKNAFLNGVLDTPVYMAQPVGYKDPLHPDYVCCLRKAIYGLKQAPRAWFQRFSSYLSRLGFICSNADTSLFVYSRGSTLLYLLVYVDDIILTGNDSTVIRQFIARTDKEFSIKDLGSLHYFLGLEVSSTSSGLFLGQAKYARDILRRAGMTDDAVVSTPFLPLSQLHSSTSELFANPTLYRSLVGALQYLTITRPDLAFAVNSVSQFLQDPRVDHFAAVTRILRYVRGTIHYGLSFRSACSSVVSGYSDADWARCLETRRSTYGYAVFLGNNIVSWSAKKQPTVSRSSTESEYRALANSAAEVVWLSHLLRDLRFSLSGPPLLLCDNRSAIFLAQNPVAHKRAKHIDIDYHFVRELVTSGKLRISHVPSSLQIADVFTKGLSRPLFEFFRSKLCVSVNPMLRLRGVID